MEFQELCKQLFATGKLLDFNPIYREAFGILLKRKIKEKKITSYQIGNMGDCGWHVFINDNSLVIPLNEESYELYLIAV